MKMADEDLHGDEITEVKTGPNKLLVGIIGGIVLFVVGFLFGMIPMWLQAHGLRSELETANHELRFNQWQNELGAATVDARRAEYGPALQSASKFFTEVTAEIGKSPKSDFTPAQIERIKALLAPRDEVITLLARSDPAAADKLSAMHVAFRAAIAPEPAPK
jgi:hypothetical protein